MKVILFCMVIFLVIIYFYYYNNNVTAKAKKISYDKNYGINDTDDNIDCSNFDFKDYINKNKTWRLVIMKKNFSPLFNFSGCVVKLLNDKYYLECGRSCTITGCSSDKQILDPSSVFIFKFDDKTGNILAEKINGLELNPVLKLTPFVGILTTIGSNFTYVSLTTLPDTDLHIFLMPNECSTL